MPAKNYMQPGTICNLRVSSFKNQTKLWRLPCGQFYEESFPDLIKLVHMMLTLISSMAWMGIGDSPNRKGLHARWGQSQQREHRWTAGYRFNYGAKGGAGQGRRRRVGTSPAGEKWPSCSELGLGDEAEDRWFWRAYAEAAATKRISSCDSRTASPPVNLCISPCSARESGDLPLGNWIMRFGGVFAWGIENESNFRDQ